MSVALDYLGAELSPAERGSLQARMPVRQLAAGSLLIDEGQLHDGLLVVESGLLEVAVDGEVVGQVGPGGWVGEVALLDPGPASATVRALEDTVALCLMPETLGTLVLEEPRVARAVVRALSVSLARRLRASSTLVIDGGVPDHGIDDPAAARGWISRLFQRLGGSEA